MVRYFLIAKKRRTTMTTCPKCERNVFESDGGVCGNCGSKLEGSASGVSPSASGAVATRVPGEREIAQKNMTVGALWCIAGLLVTGITYSSASSSSTGGSYFIWWGPVLFGGWRFLKGI